jgi:5-methylcytosine-specific restriction endonuclease McrA
MKRTPIRKLGIHPVSKTKRDIQALLRELAIKRDKVCVIGQATGRKCSNILQADHIFSRANNATFADMDNIILVCSACHLFWKPSHPIEYGEIVKKKLGKKYEKLRAMSQTTLHMTKFDWELTRMSLEKQLNKLIKGQN